MNLLSIFTLVGGVGMFLSGMNILGNSLQNMAGAGLERILKSLTKNRVKGATVGTVVTGFIQSSAATAIMVLGFLNAGIMNLSQGIPVIMGANIGSTVTGQILRLGDINSDNVFLSLVKPSSFAPIIVAIGGLTLFFAKKKKTRNIAEVLFGFGILFMGMSLMESSVAPLRNSEFFKSMLVSFSNPFVGILLGLVFTAMIQSSSASVGILQALASTGIVTFSMALPVIVGQNIGKCLTVILASIGTNRSSKRATLIDVMFNLIGGVLFIGILYPLQHLVGFSFWDKTMNRGDIADIHTLFNLITALVLLPFMSLLIDFSGKIIKKKSNSKINHELDVLDDIFLKTPSLAIKQSKSVTINMLKTTKESFDVAVKLLKKYDDKLEKELNENERFLDKAETTLNEYLVKITGCNLSEQETLSATELMHNTGDIERIGDHCVNITKVAEYNGSNNVRFSKNAENEINVMVTAVKNIMDLTINAIENEDIEIAQKVEPLEEVVDSLKDALTTKHVARLQKCACSIDAGISFVKLITCLERMSDHCSNIAIHLIQRLMGDSSFDKHEHLKKLHKGETEEYRKMYANYEKTYFQQLRQH